MSHGFRGFLLVAPAGAAVWPGVWLRIETLAEWAKVASGSAVDVSASILLYVHPEGWMMPQLHLYVPTGIANVVRQRARARNMTVSGYLAELVRREVASGWPHRYFDDVVGGWRGKPLRRPPQGRFEHRDRL